MMKSCFSISILLVSTLLILNADSKSSVDLYKVLGVDRTANQREIQKAFHKLSLKYHPDKNKDKGAQEKFAEINNAYDILSDEEKRKNYDTYGDEKGNPGFGAGYPGNDGSYTHFARGGPGQYQSNFRPEWQHTGGKGNSHSYSFSYGGSGGSGGPNMFDFGLDDILSGLFGGGSKEGGQFSGFGGPTHSQSQSRSPSKSIKTINSKAYEKEVLDQGMTWLLLSHSPSWRGNQYYQSVIEEVANSLQGAMKVGSINCETESSLCKKLGIYPNNGAPRLFVHSYKATDKGSLMEYDGDLVAKNVKKFCQEHLPRLSKRVNLHSFDFSKGGNPRVMLLSTKKDTPTIWRVLSGLYGGRFSFYDAEVHSVSDSTVKKLGVNELPAIVGWLSNGEMYVLKAGISVKDVNSAVQDLSKVLDAFEKKNKKVRNTQAESTDKIQLISSLNHDALCGDTTPVCIIGAFRSSQARQQLEGIFLATVSQQSLSRRRSGSADAISYSLLDGAKQPSYLGAFDKSGFKSSDKILIAYKPRRGKFAVHKGEMSSEELEKFVSSVLNGDVRFSKTLKRPTVK